MDKLKSAFNEWQDERDKANQIENDPKAAGAELAKDLREFLGEWRAAKAEKAKSAGRTPTKDEKDDDGNILSALFGG